MSVVGETTDGKKVVQGSFEMISSRGVQLDILVDELKRNNIVVDWIEFYNESQKHGWNIKTVLNKIEIVLIDVYDKEYSDEVLTRLKLYIAKGVN